VLTRAPLLTLWRNGHTRKIHGPKNDQPRGTSKHKPHKHQAKGGREEAEERKKLCTMFCVLINPNLLFFYLSLLLSCVCGRFLGC